MQCLLGEQRLRHLQACGHEGPSCFGRTFRFQISVASLATFACCRGADKEAAAYYVKAMEKTQDKSDWFKSLASTSSRATFIRARIHLCRSKMGRGMEERQ